MNRIATSSACLLFALVAGCKGSGGDAASGGAHAASSAGKGARKMTYPVEVAPVQAIPVEYQITAPGSIDAFEQVQVTARVAGAVDRVSFTEGQSVKRGQILVTIESERYQLAVNLAKVAVDRANANELAAEADLARREAAVKERPGLIPGEELEQYRTKVALAKADVESAKQAQRTAELNLRDAFARAPMNGVIQTRTVQTGQYIQTGAVLATLLQRDPLLLRFSVAEEDAPRIKPGMEATFRLRESQRAYTAKVTLVAGAADPKSHLVPITGQIEEKEHQYWLRPGAFCEVVVPIGNAARTNPVIPEISIRPNERGFLAYVVENNVAHERQLRLGMHTADGGVEVTEGIKAGEMLVVRGAEPLSEGAPVTIMAPDAGIGGGGGGGGGGRAHGSASAGAGAGAGAGASSGAGAGASAHPAGSGSAHHAGHAP
jgi:RND family efflux transporter MFP subunit